jgi:LAO/AO transport system kinase
VREALTTPEALADLAERLTRGDRRALARAITLVESTRADHRAAARALLAQLPPPERPSLRVGLTGTPGVGKSSFVEAMGTRLTARGLRLAVLAVDPSSARSGGSILGDKTRMDLLARDPNAFIRPSPSSASLGGVGLRTRETLPLVEAWGADVVLVETVGVGQSETMVAEMTDIFLLLLAPAGGDELQGVKRGIMEMADIILVNKADGDMLAQATRTRADYAGALRLLRRRPGDPEGYPRALAVSAATGEGLDPAWAAVEELAAARRASGAWAARRREQAETWFLRAVESGLAERMARDPRLLAVRAELGREVAAGAVGPEVAADRLLAALFGETAGTEASSPVRP